METTHAESTPTKNYFARLKPYMWWFVAGVLVAALATTALRFALAKDESVHYHANFALYINGQRDEFKSFTYYEEVAACDAHAVDNPRVRTHMHDKENQLVHVHSAGVTWGHFFANLGYTLGDDLIATSDGVFITGDDGNKLSFTLNGQSVSSNANKIIGNEDTLLINYGKDSQDTLQQRFNDIPQDAKEANLIQDPAACSGGREFNTWNRLKQALGAQ